MRAALMLGVAVSLGACGGDSATSVSNVADVVVTGTPATTMLVGDSVQLVATAVNTTGGVVSDQRVTWSSNAPTIAAVGSNGLVHALAAGSATITATVSGKSGTAALDIAFGGTVGSQGGVFTTANGAFTLSFGAGALMRETLFLVRPVADPLNDPRVVPGTVYSLGPDGVSFSSGTLTLKFDPTRVPQALAKESLQLYAKSASAWVLVLGSTVDLNAGTVTGTISGSGTYALRSTPVARIALGGNVPGGGLYVGQDGRVSATLYSSRGDTLPSRVMTWNSSAPGVATVDASGNVRAVAAGTTTISVTADTATASASLTVLSRVTADWTNATDWVTLRGDSQHSGYINATLDPVAFAERWVVTPMSGAAYWNPTAGGGRLYLAMNGPYSRIVTLDPATGSQLWMYQVGTSFGINQATYDNGTIYFASGGHEDTFMWAMDASNGNVRFKTAFASQWEHWMAPVLAGSTLVAAGGYYGGMYGFDMATGKQTFFMNGPQVSDWGPVAANGLAYVTGYTTGGGVRVVSPTDGKVAAEVQDNRILSVSTPVIGGANDLLTNQSGRLDAVDLGAKKLLWEQAVGIIGMPVVGKGVVYVITTGSMVIAFRESDGTQLWTWTPPPTFKYLQPYLLLANNLLFVGSASGTYGGGGITTAIDLSSHLAVWSYPKLGPMAMSKEGVLYIVAGPQVAAITLR